MDACRWFFRILDLAVEARGKGSEYAYTPPGHEGAYGLWNA